MSDNSDALRTWLQQVRFCPVKSPTLTHVHFLFFLAELSTPRSPLLQLTIDPTR